MMLVDRVLKKGVGIGERERKRTKEKKRRLGTDNRGCSQALRWICSPDIVRFWLREFSVFFLAKRKSGCYISYRVL